MMDRAQVIANLKTRKQCLRLFLNSNSDQCRNTQKIQFKICFRARKLQIQITYQVHYLPALTSQSKLKFLWNQPPNSSQ